MTVITNTYNKILEGIQYIKDVAESLDKFTQNFTTIFTGIYNFLEPIFSFLPWEVILLLIVSILLVSWVNGLFPTSPKWNYTLVVLFLCVTWGYSESKMFPEEGASYGRIFQAIAYLLFPIYGIGLIGWSGKKGWALYQKKKRTSPKNREEFLEQFRIQSHKIQGIGHSLLASDTVEASQEEEWQESLRELNQLIQSTLGSQK